jgi:inosine-uridine nucleoside N-ribohydrolase
MEKRKIIMDVDTGCDDAVALVMAMLDDHFDLLGITAVNGNVEVKLTTNNSLRCVEACDKQGKVKVYKGCDLPIASTLMPWTAQSLRPFPTREGTRNNALAVHPDELPLPKPTIKEERDSAVVFLINTLLNAEDGEITLVPVGPLTNIAVAMRADPRIMPKIKEIMIMGGGHEVNNSSPAAEFNVWADPEAMEIVLQSGCKITMVPLDATHICYVTLEEGEEIRKIGTKPAILVSDLIRQRVIGYAQNDAEMRDLKAAPLHDALAVCALVHPECLKDVFHCNCHTDISRGFGYGETIIDKRIRVKPEPKNCYFALGSDKDVFVKWMTDVLKKDKVARGL